MKTLIKCALLLIIVSCTKIDDASGPYTIKGKLLNNCADQQPVANQLLYFLVDVDSDEEDRVAYTDANGNFSYTFDGPPNNNSTIGGTIRLQNDKPVLCGIPSSSLTADKEMDAGIVYANTPREIEASFNIQGQGYTNLDTLIIAKFSHTDLRKVSSFKISGPFDNGITVSRDLIKYASSGVNTMPDYVSTTQPHVRRLHGTFGTACNWQVVSQDGTLGKVNYETKLLDVCENQAVFSINLPPAP